MRFVRGGGFAGACVLVSIVHLWTSGTVVAGGQASPNAQWVAPDGANALHAAVDREDIEAVARVLRAGADVNAATRFGVTPLWLAASYGNAAIIDRLLKAGADAKATNPDNGETVLMMAARTGRVDAVAVLLDQGADVNAAERLRNQTALMWAAAQKHPDVVRLLLDRGANVRVRSSTGMTPLMFAIRAGDIKSAEMLIAGGADLHTPYPDGTTPLVLAILNARYELAAMLLDHGADPNARDSNGPALHVLTWMRSARGQGMTATVERVPTGNLDTFGLAEELLAHGADINAGIDWKDLQRPAMMGAAVPSGIYYPTKLAVNRFNHVSFVGATPFWLAAFNVDAPFMRFLADHGADPTMPTRQNVTPLLAAAGIGYQFGGHRNEPQEVLEAVKLAYELGNDVHAVVDFSDYDVGDWRWNGANAMHGAGARGHVELIKWLAEKDVALDAITDGGWHPVYCAEGIWVLGIVQQQDPAARLIRQLLTERGLPQPRKRTEVEIQTDGVNRRVSARR